jgi:hypothetical protein
MQLIFEETFDIPTALNDFFDGVLNDVIWDGSDYALPLINDLPLTLITLPLQNLTLDVEATARGGSFSLDIRHTETAGYTVTLGADGNLSLARTGTIIQTITLDLQPEPTRRIRVSALDATLRVAIDDQERIVYIDPSPLPAGRMRLIGTTAHPHGVWIDQVRVWMPTSATGGGSGGARSFAPRRFSSDPASYTNLFRPTMNDSIIVRAGVQFLSMNRTRAATAPVTTGVFTPQLTLGAATSRFSLAPNGETFVLECGFTNGVILRDLCLMPTAGTQRGTLVNLTESTEAESQPSWIDDNTILFTGMYGGISGLWQADVDFQNETLTNVSLVRTPSVDTPSVAANHVIFSSYNAVLQQSHLYARNLTTGVEHVLTNGTRDVFPNAIAAPDGSGMIQIVYQHGVCTFIDSCPIWTLTFDPATSTPTPPQMVPLPNDGSVSAGYPRWSPDAAWIVVQGWTVRMGEWSGTETEPLPGLYPYHTPVVYVLRSDGSEFKRIYTDIEDSPGRRRSLQFDWTAATVLADALATATAQANATATQQAFTSISGTQTQQAVILGTSTYLVGLATVEAAMTQTAVASITPTQTANRCEITGTPVSLFFELNGGITTHENVPVIDPSSTSRPSYGHTVGRHISVSPYVVFQRALILNSSSTAFWNLENADNNIEFALDTDLSLTSNVK